MDFRAFVRARVPPIDLAREPEILDELAQHLADLYNEARAEGLGHDAALARAASALPRQPDDLAHAIESASRSLPAIIADRWVTGSEPVNVQPERLSMFADIRRDLRYAARMLAHTPGFTLVVALTMALGIGANAVIFSAVDAVLLRGAPIAEPDRVVTLYMVNDRSRSQSWSYPNYVDVRDSGAFEGVVAFGGITPAVDLGGVIDAMPGEIVTGNYFDVLGVPMTVGRAFLPEEDRPGAPVRVVVLSHAFWQSRLGGDRSAIGSTIALNGRPYTIVGVAAREFTGPYVGRAASLWVPMALQPEVRPPSAGVRRQLGSANLLVSRGGGWLNTLGRLRAGASMQETAAALDVVARRLRASAPDTNRDRSFALSTLDDTPGLRTAARPLLGLLGGAVVLVLVIACANVASLLLARAVSRRREVAVRVAIGAGRGRLVRQWLTEAVLLSLMGASGGLVLAIWGAPLLHQLGIPESVPLGVNLRVLVFAGATAVASGLLFGLVPIAQTLRRDTLTALRDEGGAVATGVRGAGLRSAFVVVQVALSLMLLVGAGLFLRTLQKAYAVDLGYQVDRTLLAEINLDPRGYTPEAGQGIYARILERIDAIPGVEAAAAARVVVLSGGARTTAVSGDGRPLERDGSNGITTRVNVVSDRYLEALGIRLLRGRSFSASDGPASPRVAVLSQSLAVRLFGQADAIGRTMTAGTGPVEVIGVVPDAVYLSTTERNPHPFYYLPLSQNYESSMTLHVRAAGDPMAMVSSIREAVREIDPQLVATRPRPLSGELDRSLDGQRMMATLVGLFGAVALALAAIGLYGIMAHAAGQRTTEIGIRLALGARPASILRLMIGSGLRLVAIGAALGLAGAVAVTRLLESQLFGVAPTDPPTFIAMVLLLLAVAAVACAIPARRAMRTDPLVVMRSL